MNQHISLLDYGRSKFRAIESINTEIDDELDFHIACRVDELVDSGMSKEEAQSKADSEFGARDAIAQQCRKINYGNRITVGRFAIFGFLAALLAIGWLGWELVAQKNANSLLNQKLAEMNLASVSPWLGAGMAAAKQEGPTDVHGAVTDAEGTPIAGAKVLLIVKSWPGGRFAMQPLQTHTEDDGSFSFASAFAKGARSEFLVTVLADGWLMTSDYVAGHDGSKLDAFSFKLEPATEVSIYVGERYAGWSVFPNTRAANSDGKEHYVYPVSGSAFDDKVEDDGSVAMNHFAPGDELRFIVTDGEEFEEVDVELPGGEKKKAKRAKAGDVGGQVADQDGNPVVGASVILLSKSWPKGRFQMKTSRVRTDAEGRFLFPKRFSKGEKGEFLVTIAHEGWALDSQYVENPDGAALEPIEFALTKAVEKTFVLKLADGSPAKNLKVYPRGCTKADGKEVYLYPVSAKYATFKTDKEGKLKMSLFAEGDTFNLNFTQARKLDGEVEVEVNADEEQAVTVQ
jgi:hypothetical protein